MITQLALVALAVGCSSVGTMKDQDAVRNAALQNNAAQRMAWEKDAQPVKQVDLHIDSVEVSGTTANVVTTQKLAKTDGSVSTVKSKQQFKKVGATWQAEGSAEQLADSSAAAKPKA
ncbi:MAG TPA: hypothetical protein VGR02_15580 [Thermoanaerobaculia bacterium]|jgi:hypothetical protein|nr:hypothetical protein [Thermoanaerobaculia bacterium]